MRFLGRMALAAAFAVLTVSGARADIHIAVAGPITGSDAAVGEQMRRGAEHGGRRHQRQRRRRSARSSRSTSATTPAIRSRRSRVANKFAVSGVVFVAGHYCSGTSIPASAVYAEAGILQISPASTNPGLTDDAAKKGWNNVFRVCGRDDVQGKVAGNYIAERFKGKQVAIIDDKSDLRQGPRRRDAQDAERRSA